MASSASYNLIPTSSAPAPVAAPTRRFSLRTMLVAAVVTVACVAFVTMHVTRVVPYPFSGAQERNMEAFNGYPMPVVHSSMYASQAYAPVAPIANSYMPNARAVAPAPAFENFNTRAALYDPPVAAAAPATDFFGQNVRAAAPAADFFSQNARAAAPASPFDGLTSRTSFLNAPAAAPIGMPQAVQAPIARSSAVSSLLDVNPIARTNTDTDMCTNTPYGVCTGTVTKSTYVAWRKCEGSTTASSCRCYSSGATLTASQLLGQVCVCVYSTSSPGTATWSMYLLCK